MMTTIFSHVSAMIGVSAASMTGLSSGEFQQPVESLTPSQQACHRLSQGQVPPNIGFDRLTDQSLAAFRADWRRFVTRMHPLARDQFETSSTYAAREAARTQQLLSDYPFVAMQMDVDVNDLTYKADDAIVIVRRPGPMVGDGLPDDSTSLYQWSFDIDKPPNRPFFVIDMQPDRARAFFNEVRDGNGQTLRLILVMTLKPPYQSISLGGFEKRLTIHTFHVDFGCMALRHRPTGRIISYSNIAP
jgi:hypothetical protein